MFLLDTNVVSEMRRPHPDLAVRTWVESKSRELQFISVITLTEIAHGIASQPDPVQRRNIQRWLDGTLRIWFQDRILTLNAKAAESAGTLSGIRQRAGKTLSLPDAFLAATAMENGFVFITRNTKDFIQLPLDTYDPWTDTLAIGEHQR